jgi:hypothetical protein
VARGRARLRLNPASDSRSRRRRAAAFDRLAGGHAVALGRAVNSFRQRFKWTGFRRDRDARQPGKVQRDEAGYVSDREAILGSGVPRADLSRTPGKIPLARGNLVSGSLMI